MYDDTPSNGRGFDEDGSLREVENARQTVSNDSPILGIVAEDGVVLLSYEAPSSSLAVTDNADNPRSVGSVVGVASAGNKADATALFDSALEAAREEHLDYGEDTDGQQVSETIAQRISQATQDFEQRPFGAAFLVADGSEQALRLVDVDGSVRQWRARAVGQRSSQLNKYLEDHYQQDGFRTEDAVAMGLDGLQRVLGDIEAEGVSALIITDSDTTAVSQDRISSLQ